MKTQTMDITDVKNIVFLTGASGLVGQSIISKIIQANNVTSLVLLIRGNSEAEAENRINDLLFSLPPDVDLEQAKARIKVIRGDITLKQLGLADSVYKNLASQITHIIHSAASVKFHLSLDQARTVNLFGTKNVVALARLAQKGGQFKRMAHISTSYISGDKSGLIKEDELDTGQTFSNTYEQAKFEAEQYIHQFSHDLPVTIFRPSIIVGDSKTGVTPSFNGIYTPLRFIYRGIVSHMPGSSDTPLDVVPVDYISDAILYILFKSKDSIGRTYHLAGTKVNAMKAAEITELAIDYFNQTLEQRKIPQIKFIPMISYEEEKRLLNHRERRTLEALKEYVPHLKIKKFFDTTNTQALLKDTGITPPPFKKYYKILLQYCLSTDWGKRPISPRSAKFQNIAAS